MTRKKPTGRSAFKAIVIALPIVLVSSAAPSEDDGNRRFVEKGVASTGLNRLLGQPIWRYPNLEQFIPMLGESVVFAGFKLAGAFDPVVGEGGGNSIGLTPTTPGNALLASFLDEIGLGLVGITPEKVPNDVLNIPVDDVAVLVGEDGVRRERVPCATQTGEAIQRTRAAPCGEPVTLKRWLRAKGVMRIKCFEDGMAKVRITMRKLLPNRMYSIWYATENFAAGPEFFITAIPFGGVPNTVVTDRDGSARFARRLGYCPHDQARALGIAVVLRANGQNFGGVPAPLLNQESPDTAFEGYLGQIPGTVVHQQLSFNINGVRVAP